MIGRSFLKKWFKALRLRQWIKNFILLIPLVFSGSLFSIPNILSAGLALLCFCFLSSGVYLINDIYDLKADQVHPAKRHRPLAAGEILSSQVWLAAFVLVVLGLLIGSRLGFLFVVIELVFVSINVSYTVWLKQLVIWDVIFLASSFVARAIAGVVAVDAYLSPWLFVLTLFLALLIALGKRRHELVLLGEHASEHRLILGKYTVQLLDQLMVIVATASIMTFILYTMAPETIDHVGSTNLVFTLPLVVYGLFRYLYLVYRYEQGGNPTETLLSDFPLLCCILLWGGLVVAIIYT